MHFLEYTIEDLDDAVGVAFEVGAELSFGFILIFTDSNGEVLGYVIFDQPHHNICDIHSWLLHNHPYGSDAVVIEFAKHNLDQLSDVDLTLYETTKAICETQQVALRDFIQVNGDCFRSFAVTVTPNQAWR